jgi:predicted Rossmann-fold nucleotide-binding protein
MDLYNLLQTYVDKHHIRAIVSFSGGSDEKESIISPIVEECIELLSPYKVAIASGGTMFSVQKKAIDCALAAELPTIGVMPERGIKYQNPEVGLILPVPPSYPPSHWGDDSEVFAKISNAVVVLGGGFGTLVEIAHILKVNEDRFRHPEEGKPIVFCPIANLGGASDIVEYLIFKDALRQCLPEEKISTGKDAAQFIIDRLELAKT